MKITAFYVFTLSALLMGAGCRKTIHSPASTGSIPTGSKGLSTSGMGGYNLTSINDRAFAFDYDGTGLNDYILFYRPGANTVTIMKNTSNTFSPAFTSNTGIGGYSLTASPANASDNYNEVGGDHMIAFDYFSTGHDDNLIIYRPGSGLFAAVKNNHNGTFSNIFQSNTGIGGYDLMSVNDKIIAFDYDGTGKKDHLLLYRPGNQTIWILAHTPGTNTFTPVIQGTAGIGGFDLKSTQDQVIAYDYNGTGHADHLLLYRPGVAGHEALWLVQHAIGTTTFSPLFTSQTGFPGGFFDLSQSQDRVITFDYTTTGVLNYLVCYRPGSQLVQIFGPNGTNNGFTHFWGSSSGIGSYPLIFAPTSSDGWVGDKVFAFNDQNGLGMSSLVLYAAGVNWISVVTTVPGMLGNFTPVF